MFTLHHLEITEILLKGCKTLTHPSIVTFSALETSHSSARTMTMYRKCILHNFFLPITLKVCRIFYASYENMHVLSMKSL